MLKCSKISDREVKPIRFLTEPDQRPIAGFDTIPDLYATVVMIGHRKVGKSFCMFDLVKECIGPDTETYVFARQHNNDDGWKAFKEWMREKNHPFVAYSSTLQAIPGKSRPKNLLGELMDAWIAEADAKEAEQDAEEDVKEEAEDKEEPKERKTKYRYPERIIILDDISSELKKEPVATLFKEGRHLRTRVFVCTQNIKDIRPETRHNTTHLLLFKGENLQKVNQVHDIFDIAAEREDFRRMYHDASKEDHGFLYCDINNNEYRRKFNYKYDVLD